MRLFIDSDEVRFLDINRRGKVTLSGDENKKDWEGVYVDLSKVKVGNQLVVSFNVTQNRRIGIDPVYTPLRYKILNLVKNGRQRKVQKD